MLKYEQAGSGILRYARIRMIQQQRDGWNVLFLSNNFQGGQSSLNP